MLLRHTHRNLYGTTVGDGSLLGFWGSYGCGTVYKINLVGNQSVLWIFRNGTTESSQPPKHDAEHHRR
jgi:uncharacterized repeat protein (TIGR03803 family)